MADECGRGHAMVGENVVRRGVNRQVHCRQCEVENRERYVVRRPPYQSKRPARVPLDPALVARLRREAGIVSSETG